MHPHMARPSLSTPFRKYNYYSLPQLRLVINAQISVLKLFFDFLLYVNIVDNGICILIVGSCLQVDPIPHSFNSVTSLPPSSQTPPSSPHARFKRVFI